MNILKKFSDNVTEIDISRKNIKGILNFTAGTILNDTIYVKKK